jgi:hypothetical protein
MASGNALILTKRMADAYFTGSFKFYAGFFCSVPRRIRPRHVTISASDIADEVTGTQAIPLVALLPRLQSAQLIQPMTARR